jgi:hypothetical protein
MATVVPTDAELAAMTPEGILELWKAAMLDGLGPGATFAPEILAPNGVIATHLLGTIQGELERRKESKKPPHSFDRAALIASTRVARDTGAVCRIMAEATKNKVVTVQVFQLVRELMKLHASCPAPGALEIADGGGPFC